MNEPQANQQLKTTSPVDGLALPLGHCQPVGQPQFVHQLTKILFAPYRVQGGSVHLVGCRLEEVPFLAVSSSGSADRSFFDADGKPLSAGLIQAIGLDNLESQAEPPPAIRPSTIKEWSDKAIGNLPSDYRQGLVQPQFEIVWCRWAQGKLGVTIGEQSQEIPFQGWAVQFASGQVRPPEFTCSHSGCRGYEVVATDDGRLTVPSAIETCHVSGRRCLEGDLESCETTGHKVLPEYLVTCPASGSRVLESSLVRCSQCDQPVARHRMEKTRCPVCRQSQPLGSDAGVWVERVRESTAAKGYAGWRISHGPGMVVVVGKNWRGRILMVFEPDTGRLMRVRRRPWWLNHWTTLDEPSKETGQRD